MKKEYIKPLLYGEKYVPEEYISTCDVKYTLYCNVPRSEITNGRHFYCWNEDGTIQYGSSGVTSIDPTADGDVYCAVYDDDNGGKLNVSSLSEVIKGYIVYNSYWSGEGTDSTKYPAYIWQDAGGETHATLSPIKNKS